MDDHAVADQRMNDGGAGTDSAVAADRHDRPMTAPGRDQRSRADLGIAAR